MILGRVPADANWLAWFDDEQPGGGGDGRARLDDRPGEVWADRWPRARLLLVSADGDVLLRGDPGVAPASALAGRVRGFVDAPAGFEPVLRAAAERVIVWPRVVQVLDAPEVSGQVLGRSAPGTARQLGPEDAVALGGLPEDLRWIWKTWGGPAELCASRFAWGAFDGGRAVVSVACSFYVGRRYEELGVVTRSDRQRRGLSTACAAGLCAAVLGRGRRPSWTTTPDNLGSLGVARRLGFRHVRDDVLYLVDIDVPA